MNNSVRVRHFDAPVKQPDACSYTGRSHCPFPASALGVGIFFLRWSSLWGLTNSRKKAEAARLRRERVRPAAVVPVVFPRELLVKETPASAPAGQLISRNRKLGSTTTKTQLPAVAQPGATT